MNYYRDFGNAYHLIYVETLQDLEVLLLDYPQAEQISRKEAISLAWKEKVARETNPAFAGFADTVIRPASFVGDVLDPPHGMRVKNCILERVSRFQGEVADRERKRP